MKTMEEKNEAAVEEVTSASKTKENFAVSKPSLAARIIKGVIMLALVGANLVFAVVRVLDVIATSKNEMPEYTLWLPMYVQPETRNAELAVVAAFPVMSGLLPVILLAIGLVSFLLRRKKELPIWTPIAYIGLSLLLLIVNGITAYKIYYFVPSFG